MKKMWIIVIHFAMTLTIWGCLMDEETELFTSPELLEYFERFQEEAAFRGLIVDYDSAFIEGIITQIEGEISGQCQYNTIEPDRVLIDEEYWESATDIQKEFIVFHELGHCYLNRKHLEIKNPDGTCQSIMHSGETGCVNGYNVITRSNYLDELFSN